MPLPPRAKLALPVDDGLSSSASSPGPPPPEEVCPVPPDWKPMSPGMMEAITVRIDSLSSVEMVREEPGRQATIWGPTQEFKSAWETEFRRGNRCAYCASTRHIMKDHQNKFTCSATSPARTTAARTSTARTRSHTALQYAHPFRAPARPAGLKAIPRPNGAKSGTRLISSDAGMPGKRKRTVGSIRPSTKKIGAMASTFTGASPHRLSPSRATRTHHGAGTQGAHNPQRLGPRHRLPAAKSPEARLP